MYKGSKSLISNFLTEMGLRFLRWFHPQQRLSTGTSDLLTAEALATDASVPSVVPMMGLIAALPYLVAKLTNLFE